MKWDSVRHALDHYFADIDDPTDDELAALEAELENSMWDDLARYQADADYELLTELLMTVRGEDDA